MYALTTNNNACVLFTFNWFCSFQTSWQYNLILYKSSPSIAAVFTLDVIADKMHYYIIIPVTFGSSSGLLI